MSSKYERKVIIIGKTGNGKSSLGNVLLGRNALDERHSFVAVTQECKKERNEGNVSVVDTPGLFDSNGEKSRLVMQALKVQKAMELCPNPHAFLIVLNGSCRLTPEELSTIDVLRIIFGEQCLRKAIIVLTHLKNNVDETKLREMLKESSEMTELINQCGDRFAMINNTEPTPEHVNRISRLVDEVSQTGKDSFKNEYLHVHERELQESLERHDSGPLHQQIKMLSEQILKAVEEEKEFKRKCLKVAGVGAVCVAAGLVYLKGGCAAVATAVTNPETAQVVIEKSINVATGVISFISSAH